MITSKWNIVVVSLLIAFLCSISEGFSPPSNNDGNSSPQLFSRRSLLTNGVGISGAVVYGKLISDAFKKLARGDLVYPEAHERRVESTIAHAILASLPASGLGDRPLRVLEVGIGKDWRVQRRGLYHTAIDQLAAQGVKAAQVTGVDIVIPEANIVKEAQSRVTKEVATSNIQVDLNVVQGSIASKLEFEDGYFDCVLCCLTLCSVVDQTEALQEMQRLVRPNGGCLGYIEHVAVNADEPYRLLEWQQNVFDPWQQSVAHNCHLHRHTEDAITSVFGASSERIFQERFLVDDMWPVTCQCCGVIQRKA
jgi:ubiquinone/menaquinone biosynthesis C-methylase UbiE